jgi:two-component system chemotaxis response regulator CheY
MKKVLVVDDSGFMRQVLKNILKEDYKIFETGNGKEAVEQFKVEKPDLVLLDIIMPKKDGIAVLDSLKKIDSDANVIMITAVGQEATIKECQKLGAKGYIIKPFDEKQVLDTVKKVLD